MTGAEIILDRGSVRPLYRQIAEAIRRKIRDGRLRPGERLPTVRELARQLDVTRPTVHRAFSDLKARGCIEATVGRGTYVRGPTAGPGRVLVAPRLTADRVLDDIERLSGAPGMRGLAHAEPAPELLPGKAFWKALLALKDGGGDLLRYVSSQGDLALREELAGCARERGIEAGPDDILVTTGVTQGMSLVTAALARPGDRVAVEQPTYLGLLHVLEAQGVIPVGIPLDDEGPRLDHLERVIAQDRPRFFYTIPVFQNPTGISMSARRRRDLMAMAGRHGLPVVEDDIYHLLAFEKPPPPPLKASDPDGRVVYLDGFSKVGLPGVRIGYAVAAQPLLDRLVSLRRADDLCGPQPLQRAMAGFLREGEMRVHLRRALPRYRRRRDALLGALQRHMPDGVTWTRPDGGFSVWVSLPRPDALDDLYAAALARGVLFTPGEVFIAGPETESHMRLCFGNQPEEVLRESVRVLADLVSERLQRERPVRHMVADRAPLV